jgi:hypothetical protein
VLVGPWARVSRDRAAAQIDDGPATSGVFARFETGEGPGRLEGLDQTGATAKTLGAGAGLVAAVRDGENPPTWVVTGTDSAGVRDAASLLSGKVLRDRYAIASASGEPVPLPVGAGGG